MIAIVLERVTMMRAEQLQILDGEDSQAVLLKGPLDLAHLVSTRRALKARPGLRRMDASGLTKLDMAGAMLLVKLARKNITVTGLQPAHATLYHLVANAPPIPAKPKPMPVAQALVVRLGRGTIGAGKTSYELIAFLGQASVAVVRSLSHPRRLRVGEVIHHIEQIGINAIPIVGLIAFLISVVLAYQSTEQLRPLGAQ